MDRGAFVIGSIFHFFDAPVLKMHEDMPELVVINVLYLQSLVLERGYNNVEFGDAA